MDSLRSISRGSKYVSQSVRYSSATSCALVDDERLELKAKYRKYPNYVELIGKLVTGDIIEIDRGKYRHWVWFDARGRSEEYWCFHVTGDTETGKCVKKAEIIREPLLDIMMDNKNSNLSPAKINNKDQGAKARRLVARSHFETLKAIMAYKGEYDEDGIYRVIVTYNLLSMNCEHYVTLWKYGKKWSGQAITGISIMTAVPIIAAALPAAIFALMIQRK